MRWAISEGIISGTGGGALDPKGGAGRNQVAAYAHTVRPGRGGLSTRPALHTFLAGRTGVQEHTVTKCASHEGCKTPWD